MILRLCKHVIVFSCTIILKFLFHFFGLMRKKKTSDDCCDKDPTVLDKEDLLKGGTIINSRVMNQTSRRHEEHGSSRDASDESADDARFVPIAKKTFTSRNRRFGLRHVAPRTSSPLHVHNREFSSSSEFSTVSDVIISQVNTIVDHSSDSGIRSNVTENDNTKLKEELDRLKKENSELQENLLQHHKRLDSRMDSPQDRSCSEPDRRYVGKSAYSTPQGIRGAQNLVVEQCTPEHDRFYSGYPNPNLVPPFSEDAECYCKTRYNDSLSRRQYSSKLEADVTSSRQCYSTLDADITGKKQLVLKNDLQLTNEMLEKISVLEKDNVRLNDYISGLLCLVLQKSPSMLET